MVCHIVIRETLDWKRVSYDQLVSPFIQETARLWDSVFRLGYMACRDRIKTIALRANGGWAHVRLVQPGGPEAFDLGAIRPEDMVLLCDDDDWYAPQLAARLAALAERRRVVIWPDAVFGFLALWSHFKHECPLMVRLHERRLDAPREQFTVRTNNYAIPGALILDRPGLLTSCWGHGGADRLVTELKELPTTTLPLPLSIANRHPCSQMVLRRCMELARAYGQDPAEALRKLVQHYARNPYMDIPTAWWWAVPLIQRTRAVFQECVA